MKIFNYKINIFFSLLFVIDFNTTKQISHVKNSLTINDYINEVITQNPDLSVVKSKIKEAELAIVRVETLDDPTFTFVTMNNPFPHQPILMPEKLRFQFGQKLPFPGKLDLKGKIQGQIAEFLKYEEITTTLDLTFQAKKLFLHYYLNKIALEINDENKQLIQMIINDALSLYKTGKGTMDDVLKAKIELEKLEEEYITLKSNRETFKAFINALRNVPILTPVFDPDITFHTRLHTDYPSLEALAIKKRPELKGLTAKITEEKFRADLAKREYFPDFEFSFGVERLKNLINKKRGWTWEFGLSFNIPIWIPRKQRREFLEAEERVSATENRYISLKNNIKARVRELIEKIKATEEIISLNNNIVKDTTETLFTYEYSYRSGKNIFLTVLDTFRELQNYLFKYEQSKIEKELLLAELERELGIPVETLLQDFENIIVKKLG